MDKKFCDVCLKDVYCVLKERIKNVNIDNYNISFNEKYYVCDECKNEFYDDLFDLNIINANNEVRKLTGLITIDEINDIMKKYNIGKKPLSIVLGMGEVTITRYLDGSNPSKENSDLLRNISKDPLLYEMFLTCNKDKITEIAYKKSLGKVKQLIMNNNKSKLYDSAIYIIKKVKDITPLSLQKLLFFSQCFSNKLINEDIFIDNSEAWIYGPVYKDIYDCFSYFKSSVINLDELFFYHDCNLSDIEKEYLNYIIKYFGCYSGHILRDMSHLATPWINARDGLNKDEYSNRLINYNEIVEYGNDICEEYNISDISELNKFSYDLFNKVNDNVFKE